MRMRMRKAIAIVAVAGIVAGVLAAMALAGTSSKLPTAAPSSMATPATQASGASPMFFHGIVQAVAAVFAVRAVDYIVANRVALAAALEASTYTTIVLATPGGAANSADTQFDNSSG